MYTLYRDSNEAQHPFENSIILFRSSGPMCWWRHYRLFVFGSNQNVLTGNHIIYNCWIVIANIVYQDDMLVIQNKLYVWMKEYIFSVNLLINAETRSCVHLHFSNIYISILYTSCPGAPVAPRHAASRQADRHYDQSRNIKYSTFRDPVG